MADFRKCLIAFALVALLSSVASAQIAPALQCTFNAAVTPTVRSEGLAELVGDIVLNCTGGTPTAAGIPVPQANVTIYLSTNLTSRVTANPFTEVFMLFDEPHSPTNSATPLVQCDPANAALGICTILGNGTGVGTYNGTAGHPNVFQARVTGNNQVTFFGVPIDPPGTTTNRIIRITNLRGNANLLGVSSTLVPTQIVANISVSPPNLLPLNNPQQTVAFVAKGLSVSASSAVKFIQCVGANPKKAADPTADLEEGGQNGQQFTVTFSEGFPSAWKEKNIQTHLANMGFPGVGTTTLGAVPVAYPGDSAQDVPGSNYFSESGFEANGVTVTGTTYPNGFGPFLPANPAFSGRGANLAGTANQGTRLMVQFNSIPAGTQLFVPVVVAVTIPASTPANVISGYAVLVSTDANGAGAFSSPASSGSTPDTLVAIPIATGGASGAAVYEILFDDPFNNEAVKIPVAVAYVANQGNNLPAPGVQSTASGSFAPLSNIGTYDTGNTAPIPRFAPSTTPVNNYSIVKCSCNLLFPWVIYTQGYDTGIAISNTTVDIYGTTPQAGNVTINYFNAATPPPAQKTNAPVKAGDSLAFTVSGGGNYGIGPVSNGFQGYVIAQAEFQFCHGYAYISSFGALPTSPGTSEGYLGIVLDQGGLERTLQIGENKAH